MVLKEDVIIANQVLTGSGAETASRPSVAFGDRDTGLYESTDDKLTVTLNGADQFHFSGAAFTQADGTPYITTATVGANAVGNAELSGQILWSKLANGTQGEILFVNSQNQVSGLAVGTSGQRLTTQGAGADPIWETVAASSAAGLQRRYIFSGSAGTTSSVWLGSHQVPANTFTSGQMIIVQGIVHSDTDGTLAFSISGSAVSSVSAAPPNGNPLTTTFVACQAKATSSLALMALTQGSGLAFSTNSNIGTTNWITTAFGISGSLNTASAVGHARLELWY